MENNQHWTARSLKDFRYSIAADFVVQIEKQLETINKPNSWLARKMKVTPARVSQLLNNPGNLTLDTVIAMAQACRLKVGIVAYDDADSRSSAHGPVNADIFRLCWEDAGKPRTFSKWPASRQMF